LTDGELAINTTDEKLYFKNASGTVKLLAANVMPVANGGTGATTASVALTNLGAVAKAGDTMTGVLAFTAGTVSAPGITFSGDTNTGIFSPAADTIAFSEGGVESMRIDSSGNVGIGTSSPSEKLSVHSAIGVRGSNFASLSYFCSSVNTTGIYTGLDSAGGYVVNVRDAGYQAFLTNNTERARIDSSGNVGIGTSSPGLYAKLTVLGGSIYTDAALYSNDGTTTARVISSGGISYWGTTTNHPMVIQTNNTERMRIDSSGNVGIGTSAPTSKLDVYAASGVQISASDGTVTQRVGYCGFGAAFSGTSSNHPYLLLTNDTERMRIDSSGNVGIGTVSPASKLDVNGAIRDSKGDVRTIVQNAQTGAYVLVAADAGKHISITTGGVTVNTSIFSAGDAISIYNNSASNQTITQGASVTMYLGGTATTGNRTLAQRGICTILCVASNTFVISGAGLT
jgi:hypothetical protein